MGMEVHWQNDQGYAPDSDAVLSLRRALAGQRPYLLLQNTRFETFGPFVERFLARSLAWGMFPSMFSHDALNDQYFRNPAWYQRDRALFKRYVPLIRAVAEEGWQPVTLAWTDNEALRVERFGPGRTGTVFLTVHNPTEAPQRGTLTVDGAALGREAPPRPLTLAPYATEVIRL